MIKLIGGKVRNAIFAYAVLLKPLSIRGQNAKKLWPAKKHQEDNFLWQVLPAEDGGAIFWRPFGGAIILLDPSDCGGQKIRETARRYEGSLPLTLQPEEETRCVTGQREKERKRERASEE